MSEQVTVDLSSAILDAFHRGLWPDLSVLTPGSPAYVRRLRDNMVARARATIALYEETS